MTRTLGITEEWPRANADIDVHQVLAYAYDVDDSNILTLHLYDPNTSPTGADDVLLTIDLSSPTHTLASRPSVGFE